MTLLKSDEKGSGRRGFVQNMAAGTVGMAVACALAELGTPAMAASHESEQTASPFFKDPPPWPKGTIGAKYDHLFCTQLKENSPLKEAAPYPRPYLRGESDLPGAKINMGWQLFLKPYKLELESHHHDTDEYLIFLGGTTTDLVGSFDAEIELFLGKEYEKHTITKATILYIPAGLEHNPLHIKRLGKPMLFSALHLAPYFSGVYQTGGYRELKRMTKID
jgi:hypothetical protein